MHPFEIKSSSRIGILPVRLVLRSVGLDSIILQRNERVVVLREYDPTSAVIDLEYLGSVSTNLGAIQDMVAP
jgi:hypothetical protein